jgi:tRNA(Ile)-lysidine synthase
MPAPALPTDDWSLRWGALARSAGIAAGEPLLLALSGGADSVLLLHWLAAARPAVALLAVHVDHGLRGAESEADARFARELCRSLGVPFRLLRAALEPGRGNLEARARAERYRLLAEAARASGHRTVLTGHHGDDALETVLMRWTRGTALTGLRGPRAELAWRAGTGAPVRFVRPLLTLRREEVRALLAARGLRWREDSSNRDRRFTRTRVRHGFLPLFRRLGGEGALAELCAFSRVVEELESEFARATAHLAWRPSPHGAATRPLRERHLGGVLARGELARLARPLARRVLWRLLTEGTGQAPARAALEAALADLGAGRTARHCLARGWSLWLRSRELVLVPPPRPASPETAPAAEPWLPFPGPLPAPRAALRLEVPGIVTLADGRRISAERLRAAKESPVPRSAVEVELDAELVRGALAVRALLPGDRFHPLGAPGSKPLARFLAGRGVPREERANVPLVTAASPGDPAAILWVVGLAPCETCRVRARTEWRLRLALHG